MLVLDMLMTDGLAFDDPSHLEEWSRRALAIGPKVTPVVATRGGVLVELGRHAEGKAVLELVVEVATDGLDRFLPNLFLGSAELALGRVDEAQRRLVKARNIAASIAVPPPFLGRLSRLEAAIGPRARSLGAGADSG